MIKVGILKETKVPIDRRVAMTPKQAVDLLKKFPDIELFIQSSDIRCIKDKEYKDLGINVVEDLKECDVLLGVKEVDIPLFAQYPCPCSQSGTDLLWWLPTPYPDCLNEWLVNLPAILPGLITI